MNQAEKKYGQTPMHIAAYNGHNDTVKVLASLHADVNQARKDGRTPLRIATAWGKMDTAAVLGSLGGRMESTIRWKFPKSEAKTSDIDNLVFLACI